MNKFHGKLAILKHRPELRNVEYDKKSYTYDHHFNVLFLFDVVRIRIGWKFIDVPHDQYISK